jgi:hypothetical protein
MKNYQIYQSSGSDTDGTDPLKPLPLEVCVVRAQAIEIIPDDDGGKPKLVGVSRAGLSKLKAAKKVHGALFLWYNNQFLPITWRSQ